MLHGVGGNWLAGGGSFEPLSRPPPPPPPPFWAPVTGKPDGLTVNFLFQILSIFSALLSHGSACLDTRFHNCSTNAFQGKRSVHASNQQTHRNWNKSPKRLAEPHLHQSPSTHEWLSVRGALSRPEPTTEPPQRTPEDGLLPQGPVPISSRPLTGDPPPLRTCLSGGGGAARIHALEV